VAVWLQGDGMTVGLAWWATGTVEDWEGLNPCRENDRAYLAERGAAMSVFIPGVDAVSVLRGSRPQQVCVCVCVCVCFTLGDQYATSSSPKNEQPR